MEPGDVVPAPAGPVRDRVVALAAARLGDLTADVVPAPVRAFVRFTPTKRARLAAGPLAAALAGDPVFRQAVAAALPDVAPDAAPAERAAQAWLRRTEGWRPLVEQVAADLAAQEAGAQEAAGLDAVARLTEQLEAVRAGARAEADRLRAELAAAREETAAVRRELRSRGERTARAEALARAAVAERDAVVPGLEEARRQVAEAQARAEAVLAAAPATAPSPGRAPSKRATDDLRLRVLLDTLLGAASGLRRELALPPLEGRPADAVVADYALAPTAATAQAQGRDPDDPALLDALLAVPMTHVLVDGYNVTKTGYGEVPLEAQRRRLLSGLGALAARTGAEVTVVFDGAERVTPAAVAAPRGVRLLFSREGETADDVLVRLVGLEPAGRPVLVVSSDGEVADGTRRGGGRPVPSRALLRLLDRG